MSSLLRAIIAEYLLSFPDLTPKNVNKISTPDITVQGHMDQIRKNYQSTKPKIDEDEWTLTLKSYVPTKTNDFFHKVLNLDHKVCIGQTEKFNVRSTRGHNYTMVTYCYDSNAILVRPLLSKKGSELLDTI